MERQRLLVVDDEPDVRQALEQVLTETYPNVEVVSAGGGEEALHLAQRRPFDIVVTDFRMPHMNGAQLAEGILRLHPQAQVVVNTAYDDDMVRGVCAKIGAHVRVIHKAAFRELMATIAGLVDARRPGPRGAFAFF